MENAHVENEMNRLCVVSDHSQMNGRQQDGKQNEGVEIVQTDQLNKTLAVRKNHTLSFT